jgi:anti-sigma-K factor RskA
MRHEELEELIPLHALDALDGDDLRAVEAHLREGCPRCESLIREHAGVAARLGESLPDAAVPPQVKRRLLDRIGRELRVEASAPPPRRRPWLLPWGVAIAATAAASLLLWNGLALRGALERERVGTQDQQRSLRAEAERLRDQLAVREAEVSTLRADLTRRQSEFAQLQTQYQEQRREVAARIRTLEDRLRQETVLVANLQGRLSQQEAIIRLVEDPQSRVVALDGLKPAPQASGRVIWHSGQQRALFFAHRLPALPSGKTYQLWTITDQPISGGVFDVDPHGNATLPLTAVPRQVKTFAVTIEPAGGLPQPSGAIYLAGSL